MVTCPVPGVPGAVAREVEELPEHLPGALAYSPLGEMAGAEFLLNVEGTGRYHVRSDSISYSPGPGADPILVERFLWGAARSALIHLRGEIPLHASVVSDPESGRALALCGQSGAGKSSAAAALRRAGWVTLTDDQARLTVEGPQVMAWPGPALARVCPDMCEALEIDVTGLRIDCDDRSKRLVPLVLPDAPVRLAAIVELGPGPHSEPSPLEPALALATLSRNVVGQRKWRAARSAAERFASLDSVASRLRVYQLHRGRDDPIALTAQRLIELASRQP